MGSLVLASVSKAFADIKVLHDIDIAVADGEFVAFVGPSGCGKSTLLRIIAGLDEATAGSVIIDGIDMVAEAPAKRGIAMVFQTYALYPHLTVRGNMTLGLRQAKTPLAEIERRLDQAASMLHLEALLERRPAELSGGQRQRVAIGRAIVRQPKLFLFDEPLSNLDAALRVNTRLEIAKLHRELGATMIYVTHDQVEAMTLADKIVVLNGGRVEQIGSPMELYNRPVNRFVAGFIGSPQMNFIDAAQLGDVSGHVMGIRPEHFTIIDAADAPALLTGTVQHVEHLGADSNLYVGLSNGQQVTVRAAGEIGLATGAAIRLGVLPGRLHAFDKRGLSI
tara:strand:- start:593 stop:1600 length:1008 start_codon:yes stop_codon:yes gene_type:complete